MRHLKELKITDGGTEVTGKLGAFMKMLSNETDRGVVIIVATALEERLRKTLREFFVDEPESVKLLKRNFQGLDSLARACFCMGLISRKELNAINAIRVVRNDFAHQFLSNCFDGTLECKKDEVFAAVKDYLPGVNIEGFKNAREAFDQIAVVLIFELWERDQETVEDGHSRSVREF